MSLRTWLRYTLEMSKLPPADYSYHLNSILDELKVLNNRITKLVELVTPQPVQPWQPPNVPHIPMRSRIRTSNGLIEAVEARSFQAAIQSKEAPKPEEVK